MTVLVVAMPVLIVVRALGGGGIGGGGGMVVLVLVVKVMMVLADRGASCNNGNGGERVLSWGWDQTSQQPGSAMPEAQREPRVSLGAPWIRADRSCLPQTPVLRATSALGCSVKAGGGERERSCRGQQQTLRISPALPGYWVQLRSQGPTQMPVIRVQKHGYPQTYRLMSNPYHTLADAHTRTFAQKHLQTLRLTSQMCTLEIPT